MSDITVFQLITLVVAVIGAVSGIGALLWNIAEFRLQGPRVQATIQASMHNRMQTGFVIGGSKVWNSRGIDGYDIPGVSVVVTNKGRSAATIKQISIECNQLAFVPIGELIGLTLPYRLEPFDSQTWHTDLRLVSATVDTEVAVLTAKRRPVRAKVSLGDGSAVVSKNELTVPRIS